MIVVSVVGDECSAVSRGSCRLSCLEVTRVVGESGRNVLCNVGVTQPIGIFLPPPSGNSMQLCGFHILPQYRKTTSIVCHLYLQLFWSWSMQWSPPVPLLPAQFVFPIIVWTCGLPALNVQHSTCPFVPYSRQNPPPIPTLFSPSLSS
jgi:hypothetical protein